MDPLIAAALREAGMSDRGAMARLLSQLLTTTTAATVRTSTVTKSAAQIAAPYVNNNISQNFFFPAFPQKILLFDYTWDILFHWNVGPAKSLNVRSLTPISAANVALLPLNAVNDTSFQIADSLIMSFDVGQAFGFSLSGIDGPPDTASVSLTYSWAPLQ